MRELDIPMTAKDLIAFIQASVRDAGFSRLVVAVSGGIDSAIATTLASAALGPENIFPLLLPYKDWHTVDIGRAQWLLQRLHIPADNICEVDLAPMVDAFLQSTNLKIRTVEDSTPEAELDMLRVGNIMARVRMVVLFDQAKKHNALVLGTENKSEHYLGYYTRFGDEASDIEPLRNLYKTELYPLAEYLQISLEIQEAVPSAGLWPGQTDEGQFGFTYQQADKILHGLFEEHLSSQELVRQGQDREVIDAVQAWVASMAFKHNLPIIAP